MDSQMVLLPVRVRHLDAVMSYRDELEAGQVVSVAQGDQETVSVPGQGDWTQARLRRLKEVVSYTLVRALLDACAAHPGEWVDKATLPSGDSPYHLRNQLSAFSKLLINTFGQKYWPIEWRKRNGAYEYRMPPEVAEWWRAL